MRLLGSALTLFWVCLAWIFFRSPDPHRALVGSRAFALFDTTGESVLGDRLWLVLDRPVQRYISDCLAYAHDGAFAGLP